MDNAFPQGNVLISLIHGKLLIFLPQGKNMHLIPENRLLHHMSKDGLTGGKAVRTSKGSKVCYAMRCSSDEFV